MADGGRSTGTFAATFALHMEAESWLVAERATEQKGILTEEELKAAIECMRMLVDAEAKGHVRKVSLIPLAVAIPTLENFENTEATTAVLNVLKSLPMLDELTEANKEDDPAAQDTPTVAQQAAAQ